MKVLLTGPFGNIGTNALINLLEQGHDVRCFDIRSENNERVAGKFEGRVDVVWGDIRNPDDVAKAVEDREVVIHLAFIIPVESEVNPELSREINVGGTKNLLAAMKGVSPPLKFVFASSCTVFGPTQDQPPPRKASDPVNPTINYTQHKVECEEMVKGSGFDWTILRFGAVPPVELKFNPMVFFLSPESRMEFVHSKDVGLALANAVSCDEAWGKILLIGGGPQNQMYYRDYITGSMEASGIGRFPDEAFGTIPSSMDWLDTEESQRLLDYQKHTYEDFLRDRKASLGLKRYLIRIARPVIRRKWLKHSPFYQASKKQD
jgi:nucleoside-diphosphate-sugar epimerase